MTNKFALNLPEIGQHINTNRRQVRSQRSSTGLRLLRPSTFSPIKKLSAYQTSLSVYGICEYFCASITAEETYYKWLKRQQHHHWQKPWGLTPLYGLQLRLLTDRTMKSSLCSYLNGSILNPSRSWYWSAVAPRRQLRPKTNDRICLLRAVICVLTFFQLCHP